jgi:hypothetical protein
LGNRLTKKSQQAKSAQPEGSNTELENELRNAPGPHARVSSGSELDASARSTTPSLQSFRADLRRGKKESEELERDAEALNKRADVFKKSPKGGSTRNST